MNLFLVRLGKLADWLPIRNQAVKRQMHAQRTYICQSTGKHKHSSQGAADAQRRSLEKRDLHGGQLRSYRCGHCGSWHVGHRI